MAARKVTTLEDASKDHAVEVAWFKDWWEAGHEADPVRFPLKMTQRQWDRGIRSFSTLLNLWKSP